MATKILKIQYKKSSYMGHECRTISGHMSYDGMIQVLVDKIPLDFDHKRIGSYLYAEIDGFVSIYKHEPGTTSGFGGRKITLTVEGGKVDYKGSLWDPFSVDNDNVPEYRAISITDDPKVMEDGHTFYHFYVTKKLYDELCNKLKDEIREARTEKEDVENKKIGQTPLCKTRY
jgi:hypothetical protein